MLLTRTHLNKSYLEELKKTTSAASQRGELDPAQIKKLAKQTVGGVSFLAGLGEEGNPALQPRTEDPGLVQRNLHEERQRVDSRDKDDR